jgi:hypothetical protein
MKVVVKNDLYQNRQHYFFDISEFNSYEGDETKLKHIDQNEYLCLTTGLKDFPVRVINRNKIVSIDNNQIKQAKVSSVKLTKIVKGSKGDEYIVTKENGQWSCTCVGFQFRRKCKHVG